jgi:hypothetical protein
MAVPKPYLEFHAVDLETGWEVPPGYHSGIQQKILAGSLDEARKRGSRTRLIRFEPGTCTTEPFVHDYWEEVYVIVGDLVAVDAKGNPVGERLTANTYACRPPRTPHGPFKTETGTLALEIHYYDPA